jgi:carboxyl-terminal processing protease
MAKTQNQQVPWDSSSLTAPFFFRGAQFNTASQAAPTPAPAAPPAANAAPTAASTGDAEEKLWKYVETTKQAEDYQAYLEQYPNGVFAPIAKNRLASIGTGAPREQSPLPEVQPTAAVAPAPEPAPVPETKEASTTDAPAAEAATAKPASLKDSRGVDCKVKDLSRSESDLTLCKAVMRSSGGGGGGGYGGGSKSTGSQRWQ